ncbi:MAG: flagellar hook-basal body complex protein [Planctomycetota bacterium]|nr:MAG: flagellar hook-basal body complex protein [Planctomycetota bacterium]
MTSSLFAALSGMRVHQQWIDVIGNNLANLNTPGFKSSRVTFADSLSQTQRHASGPSTGTGGRNPMQIGLGVLVSSIDRLFMQGALTTTGRVFDLALEGKGFFALSDGAQRYFSRVGTFGLDSQQNLVDQGTGFKVLNAQGQPVTLDVASLFPPKGTESMTIAGNLPAVVTGPLAEVLTGSSGLTDGSPAVLVSGTPGPNFAVPVGSSFAMEISVNNAAAELVTVTDGDLDGTLTITEIAAAIDSVTGVTAVVNGALIEVTSTGTGNAVSLKVNGGPAGTDLASLIGMPLTQVNGSESPVDATTDLNDLPANSVDYQVGDRINIVGEDTDGAAINAAFVYGVDGTTVNDLVAFADGLFADATVSLNASGQFVVEAATAGEAELLLEISDDAAAIGGTQWSTYATAVTTNGTGPDEVTTSTEVFDSAGTSHTLTLTFERQPFGTGWTLTASLPESEGSVVSPPITDIQFNEDGSPIGLGSVGAEVQVLFDGQQSPSVMMIDLGSDFGFDGLTQFGGIASAYVTSQDGYGDGELSNLAVDANGNVEGFYTNGQIRTLGDIGIATFANREGLSDVGRNMWIESVNSGAANLGTAGANSAGSLVSGALEGSNVDTAEQFVRLIEAQRGFQANARIISTQDEILAEVVNLI